MKASHCENHGGSLVYMLQLPLPITIITIWIQLNLDGQHNLTSAGGGQGLQLA